MEANAILVMASPPQWNTWLVSSGMEWRSIILGVVNSAFSIHCYQAYILLNYPPKAPLTRLKARRIIPSYFAPCVAPSRRLLASPLGVNSIHRRLNMHLTSLKSSGAASMKIPLSSGARAFLFGIFGGFLEQGRDFAEALFSCDLL
jgi:hypothetical protein